MSCSETGVSEEAWNGRRMRGAIVEEGRDFSDIDFVRTRLSWVEAEVRWEGYGGL